MNNKIKGAVVELVQPNFVRVRIGNQIKDSIILKGFNRPKDVEVGDVGIVEYKKSGAYALWWFKKNS